MNRWLVAMAVGVIAGLPVAASAATKIQPGLWETTATVNLGEGMPQMPPEMRAQMKQMGVQIPGVEPIVRQTCITPEQAAQDRFPDANDPDSGCRVQGSKREGDVFTADLVCEGRMRGKGRMTTTLRGSKAYSGNMAFNGTSEEGMPASMSSQFSGKWLAADCGKVQPY